MGGSSTAAKTSILTHRHCTVELAGAGVTVTSGCSGPLHVAASASVRGMLACHARAVGGGAAERRCKCWFPLAARPARL